MKKIFSVSQINLYIKRIFQSDYLLRNISVKGEVSNCKYHSSGHIYFSVKDDKSAISCVMFAGERNFGLNFQLCDGQSVQVCGNISVYERDGSYQLYAREITLDGQGILYEKFEKLKQKLYEEGLFDHEHKKEIPAYPKSVGIVTADTGAAIRDIQSVARRRNPYVQLYLYPAKVQGRGAKKSIASGIKALDRMNLDTIIVGRGGGSIEDLWPFNEEIVARAIFEAKTPIISGTGHEIDMTIADYVADLRAPTPSAACELAIPDYSLYAQSFIGARQKLAKLMYQKIAFAKVKKEKISMQLAYLNPENRLREDKKRVFEFRRRLAAGMEKKLHSYMHDLALYQARLNSLSPGAKLTAGYGYVEDEAGRPLSSVKTVEIEEQLRIRLRDGLLLAKVIGIQREEEEDENYGENKVYD